MDEYKNEVIQILNRAKEQLSENEYTQLLELLRKIVKGMNKCSDGIGKRYDGREWFATHQYMNFE